jgi:hypothetical protein
MEAAMNRLTRYERALIDRLVAENERRRRREGDARPQIPAYDRELPPPESPRRPVERPHAIVLEF